MRRILLCVTENPYTRFLWEQEIAIMIEGRDTKQPSERIAILSALSCPRSLLVFLFFFCP